MAQETLNIFLAVFLLLMAVCALTVSYFLIRALKAIINFTDHINDTAESLKNKLQLKALAAVPAILLGLIRNFRKRG